MKIFVEAKPGSKNEGVERVDENHFIVRVKEPPRQGRANRAIIKALGEHLGVAYSRITLVSGFSSKRKAFEIL